MSLHVSLNIKNAHMIDVLRDIPARQCTKALPPDLLHFIRNRFVSAKWRIRSTPSASFKFTFMYRIGRPLIVSCSKKLAMSVVAFMTHEIPRSSNVLRSRASCRSPKYNQSKIGLGASKVLSWYAQQRIYESVKVGPGGAWLAL